MKLEIIHPLFCHVICCSLCNITLPLKQFFLLLKKIQMGLMRQCTIAKLDRVGPVDNRPPIN